MGKGSPLLNRGFGASTSVPSPLLLMAGKLCSLKLPLPSDLKHSVLMILLCVACLTGGLGGCASTRLGYILKNVAMDQDGVEACDPDTAKVYALSAEEVMSRCGNWLGCIFFATDSKPATVYYKKGYREILMHERDHCLARGPLHESDLPLIHPLSQI